jgi:hypothetical protein
MEGIACLLFAWLPLALLFGFLGAWFGGQRNRAAEGFMLGLFLGPFGWLLALLLPSGQPPAKWRTGHYYGPVERTEARRRAQVSTWLDQQHEPPARELSVARPLPPVLCCPHCQSRLSDDGSLSGRLVACPRCQRSFQMPVRVAK